MLLIQIQDGSWCGHVSAVKLCCYFRSKMAARVTCQLLNYVAISDPRWWRVKCMLLYCIFCQLLKYLAILDPRWWLVKCMLLYCIFCQLFPYVAISDPRWRLVTCQLFNFVAFSDPRWRLVTCLVAECSVLAVGPGYTPNIFYR